MSVIKPTQIPDGSLASVKPLSPIWGRLPDAVRLSGLNESRLKIAMREGKIRTVSVADPGASRGCRLIHLPSVLEWIESFEDTKNS